MKYNFPLLLLCLFSIAACNPDNSDLVNENNEREDYVIQKYLEEEGITEFTKYESGLYKVPIDTGDGIYAVNGDTVDVHYTGFVLYGKIFDSSFYHDPAEPINYAVGNTNFINGWYEATYYMSKGEKALFIMPSRLGYGSKGATNIPANAIIAFEMEMINKY